MNKEGEIIVDCGVKIKLLTLLTFTEQKYTHQPKESRLHYIGAKQAKGMVYFLHADSRLNHIGLRK